jgi:hypothetical protein
MGLFPLQLVSGYGLFVVGYSFLVVRCSFLVAAPEILARQRRSARLTARSNAGRYREFLRKIAIPHRE